MKQTARTAILLATVLLASACAGTAAPAAKVRTLYVAAGGGGVKCERADPCGSFEAGYRAARPGNRIVVAGGAYGPQVIPTLGRARPRIEFTAARGERVTVAGLDIRADHLVVRRIKSSAHLNVDSQVPDDFVDDVTLVDAAATTHVLVGTRDFVWRGGSIGPKVDEKLAFIAGRPTNYRVTYDRVTWHDATRTNADVHTECLMVLGVQGLTIKNSRFTNCAVFDILISRLGGDPLSRDIVIENTVLEASKDVDGSDGYQSLLTGTDPIDGLTLRNNTWDLGMAFQGPITRGHFVGNIGRVASCADGVNYSRNVFTDRRCGATDRLVRGAFSQFVNPQKGDWRLARGAAAIGAADARNHPKRDARGARRDGRPDAGAYEYKG
ncbi:hypothetical protein OJ998_06200 [Solirubrobacter taibaiensis]|nr:hypothetical protein [Solirubrobacter taibaiensis]